jgi:hypothetical protein
MCRAISSCRSGGALAALLLALLALPAAGQPVRGGALPTLFPPDNWWNVDVSAAPVDSNSASFIQFIGPTRGLHPDFGGDSAPAPEIYGMVYMTVPGDETLEPMAFDYADQSDYGAPGRPPGYPIPSQAKTQTKWIEGGYAGNSGVGGDKHMLIVDRDNRLLFETWNTRCLPTGSPSCSWRAGSGAIFLLDSNERRPDTWTSADAAGLAILPGLIRYDEANGATPIRHAFRVTTRDTNGYVYPASHEAGNGAGAPPMGMRLRLKASKDISGYPAYVQRIFQAMKTYGLIVADNGSDMYIQGTYDTRWDNDVLNPAFDDLLASDFEVIQLGWKPAVGMAASAAGLHTLTPCRIADTRDAPGAYGGPALAPGRERVFVLTGRCGVPAGAKAVSVNLTVTQPAADGAFRAFPGDGTPSAATALSFSGGRTRANNAILMLSSSGSGAVTVRNESNGTAHVLIDVNGYLQ